VTVDRQLTSDSAYADIVLPATTYFENTSYMTYGSLFKIRERMIEPLGEARSDVFILSELAKRLGYGHLYPQNEEELLKHALAGSGFSIEDVKKSGGMVSIDTEMMQYKKWEKGKLRKDGKPGFETPTGKFEIASTILEEFGYEPLPEYSEPKEGPLSQPELLDKYPLVFNSGARVNTSFHTQHHGIKGLSKDRPEPTVMINSEDAAARGITNGDRVMIKTPRGSVVQRAIVTGDIKQGCIDANHACGSPVGPEAWKKSNINDLTDLDNYDPISGFPVYKSLLCEIVKVEDDGALLLIDSGEIRSDEIEVAEIKKSDKTIYLDNNATTKIADEVKDHMIGLLDVYGNPSSIHSEGKQADQIVEQARRKAAQQINCTARRIIFTGSGTEADNIAIKGVALASNGKKNHIITTSIEHPAVLNSCRWLETQGFKVSYLPVDKTGIVDSEDLKKTITDQTCLVSIMLANNVTGSIQPVKELAEIAKKRGITFHTDAVQAIGKIPVDVEELGVDLLSISGHKFHGPKGVGALYIKKGIDLEYLIHGGGQEYGIRSATENVMGVAGLGKAMEMVPGYLNDIDNIKQLRDRLQSGIKDIVPEHIFVGNADNRLPNTLNIIIPGVRGESIVLEAAKRGLCFSSGSACHSGSSAPSYVLLAMGLTEEEAHCSLRFSLGYKTSEEEILKSLDIIREIINDSKNIIRFVPCK
jgi:cysteine desulfurase NifS